MRLLILLVLLLIIGYTYSSKQKTGKLGIGMNIINMETYQPIFKLEYNRKLDSNKYILDDVREYNIPTGTLSTYSVVIDQMKQYTEQLGVYIEGNNNWLIKASFSDDYIRIRDEISKKHQKVAMVGATVKMSMLSVNMNNINFSNGFEDLIYRIYYCLDKSTKGSLELLDIMPIH